MTADNTVTTVPTSSPAMIALGGMTTLVDGKSIPIALMTALRPIASPTPATTPTTEASTPTTTDSPNTWPITWRWLAPIARSSAISRVRCATTIENVL